MCKECGCGETGSGNSEKKIKIDKSVLEVNDAFADQNRNILAKKGILCVNIMGSPGSGKTTVIEGISEYIEPSEIAVIQGDLESDVDKKRLEEKNISTYQINTHSGCHLNAAMINEALAEMDLKDKKYLLIENVGNLVCPAGIYLGQNLNILVSSVAEGSDKPKKYPPIFLDASLVVISKYDLAEAVEFDEKQYLSDIKKINGHVKIIKTSKKKPESFGELAHLLEHQRDHMVGREHGHEHTHEHVH